MNPRSLLAPLKTLRFWKRLFFVCFVAGLLFVLPPAFDALTRDPKLALTPPPGQRLTDRSGKLFLQWPEYRRPTVPSVLPEQLCQAVMAREDKRFDTHCGVDFIGLLRALKSDIRHLRIKEGGSTMTMQLVQLTYKRSEKTILERLHAKVFETILAIRIESAAEDQTGSKRNGKRLIMSCYLDRIAFGNNCTGIAEAAHATFGKPVKDLILGESAYLAGLIRAPTANNVYRNPSNAIAARNAVIQNMLKLEMIDQNQATKEARFFALPRPISKKMQGDGFTSVAVKQELAGLQKQGLVSGTLLRDHDDVEIHLSLDTDLQESVHAHLKRKVAEAEKAFGRNPSDQRRLNGCVVVLDNASGVVRACVGGRDFNMLQVNIATDGNGRPIASALKPFNYAACLENYGIGIRSLLSNAPLNEKESKGYRLGSAPRESLPPGMHPFWVGLKESSNRMAVRAGILGGSQWSRIMHEMHFMNGERPLDTSLFLGSSSVTPIKAAAAYACLANKGTYATPSLIERILVDGKEVYVREPHSRKVLSPAICDEITKALREVLRSGTAAQFGGRDLARRFPLAGKTGTSENSTDVWFCGYSSEVTVVVWMGYPHGTKPINPHASGGNLAFPLWKNVIEELAKKQYAFNPIPELRRPATKPVPKNTEGY